MERTLYRQMREIEDRHWWFRGRRRIVESMLARWLGKQQGRILDVGCGTGGNLAMLGAFGDVVGMEPDEEARTLANERELGPVLPGSLPGDLPHFGAPFDAIVMLDVLEHLDDDVAGLRVVKELLSPEGLLLLTVPAFPFLWSRHDEIHHHKRRYLHETLSRVISASGLSPVYCSYFNFFLFPVIAAVRMMRHGFPAETENDLAIPAVFLNSLLEKLFSAEGFLLGRMKFPFGVSLMMVAARSGP